MCFCLVFPCRAQPLEDRILPNPPTSHTVRAWPGAHIAQVLCHWLWAAKDWPGLWLGEQRRRKLAPSSLLSKKRARWPLQEAGTVGPQVHALSGGPLKLDKRTDGHTPHIHRHMNAHTLHAHARSHPGDPEETKRSANQSLCLPGP